MAVLELTAIPLAMFAGVLSVLSPCVWPLIPVIMASATTAVAPWFVAMGLATAFAVAGTFLSYLLLSLGLDPQAFRGLAAVMLIALGIILLHKPLGDWLTLKLSGLTGRINLSSGGSATSPLGYFVMGALLGLVWLPCVGPTLGTAIALASVGQDMLMAFMVMLAFGIGTALTLIIVALMSKQMLQKMRPGLMSGVESAKRLMGVVLLLLGVMVLTGADKYLETLALAIIPQWAISF